MADDDPERRRSDELSLAELREEIEAIDRELVELIAQRTNLAETIARVKAAEGHPTVDEDQEQRVLDRAAENAARFEVEPDVVEDVFRLLIELNKMAQRERR